MRFCHKNEEQQEYFNIIFIKEKQEQSA